MSVIFLTSSPTGPLDQSRKVDGIDDKNNFYINLKMRWKEKSRCLMITAFPDNAPANDQMCGFFKETFAYRGLTMETLDLWDDRTVDYSKESLDSYDVIFLGGGHVPTQNRFFERIGLRHKIKNFKGMIIGISAGTMNSADVVYAQPEMPGESIDPQYQRFLLGLGLTKTNILPHYQMVKDYELDGRRLFEDITYEDSCGHQFLALCDGSYLLIEDDKEMVYGESYVISNGKLNLFCYENETRIYRQIR